MQTQGGINPGGPGVKTLPSSADAAGSTPGVTSHRPCSQNTKTSSRSNIVANQRKAFFFFFKVHIKKSFKKCKHNTKKSVGCSLDCLERSIFRVICLQEQRRV